MGHIPQAISGGLSSRVLESIAGIQHIIVIGDVHERGQWRTEGGSDWSRITLKGNCSRVKGNKRSIGVRSDGPDRPPLTKGKSAYEKCPIGRSNPCAGFCAESSYHSVEAP